jgi:hypothetical protein
MMRALMCRGPRTQAALQRQPGEVALLVAVARVHEALGQAAAAEDGWRAVLAADASNVEAVASLAAQHFYSGQPEVALRLYRRWAAAAVEGRRAGLQRAECTVLAACGRRW